MGMNEEYGYNIQTTNTQTEIKIQNDYIECLKYIIFILSLIILIFVIGLVVTLIIVYG
tara:strand:- start:136 stop:309 length:174 start_codon:yes stop_codon:yes gene_type:complete